MTINRDPTGKAWCEAMDAFRLKWVPGTPSRETWAKLLERGEYFESAATYRQYFGLAPRKDESRMPEMSNGNT